MKVLSVFRSEMNAAVALLRQYFYSSEFELSMFLKNKYSGLHLRLIFARKDVQSRILSLIRVMLGQRPSVDSDLHRLS